MRMLGFARPDGQKGIRNKVSIIYTVDCARFVAQKLKMLYPEHTQLFGYPGGCAFEDGPVNKIIALGNHSSSAGALVLGLGCEGTNAHKVAEKIAATGRPVETVVIQETGGDILTIEKGSRALVHLIQQASMVERVDMTPDDLVVGSECGGSDATSGLASNPLTGIAGDLLIEAGGTYMHEEVSELMGCADVMAARAVNVEVSDDIREAIE
ncbi:MAG: hydrolase, partial [Candidatus Latescibacteria bacterium]|nr:hydrolase [Candidatus Latescibacterota bacterium]